MLVSSAWAQTAGGMNSEALMGYMPLIAVFAIFYFLVMRPQSKKMKEHQEMCNGLNRGDKVLTSGGIIVEVKKVLDDETVSVALNADTEVKLHKTYVVQKLNASEAADVSDKKPAAKKTTKKAKKK